MSSMRNAVQRRNHKERAQPLERSKWGLLEKHKDYSLRAGDHNEKKRRIKVLKQKVALRNPDEFAFGMMSSTTENGIRVKKRDVENGTTGPLDMDVARLLKTQDAGYLRTILSQIRSQRERLREEAALARVDVGTQSKPGVVSVQQTTRIVFDNDKAGIAVKKADDMEFDDGDSDSDESVEDNRKASTDPVIRAQIVKERQQRRTRDTLSRKLELLSEKEAKLSQALDRLENQRARMSNTIGGVNKHGVRFKMRERKR